VVAGLRTEFFQKLGTCEKPVLLLDYDETLAPFTVEPKNATPDPGVVELLQRILKHTRTRVIFVSGRTVADLGPILDRYCLSCEIWGVHGRERRCINGTYLSFQNTDQLSKLLHDARKALEMEGLGGLAELKSASVAVHWRGLDAAAQRSARRAALRVFSFLRTEADCRALELDYGVELLLGRRDRGDVVRAILREVPVGTAIAYLGNDLSDDDAFLALRDVGLSVLVRSEYRPSSAEVWIKPPDGLLDFLGTWYRCCGGVA
jgi:trehalose-phosphatase